ncbi:DUF2795 domain-containing protein [Deinococcus aluminii]|uniref:DUF2795 domain-containing protein n=1 Tax=Deinococcus aluminii TaxID=1656885 RepID=A0ABP9XHS5_9DEIO
MAKINPIQLQKHLKGVDYPASKQDLVQAAEQNGADENVRAALDQLPDEQYQTPADVSKALGDVEDGGGSDQDDRGHGQRGGRDGEQDRREQGDNHGQDDDHGGQGARINPIQLQKHLKGVDYPASKQDLVQAAERNGADENVRAALDRLPDNEYNKPSDVSKALGDLEGGGDHGGGRGDRNDDRGRDKKGDR